MERYGLRFSSRKTVRQRLLPPPEPYQPPLLPKSLSQAAGRPTAELRGSHDDNRGDDRPQQQESHDKRLRGSVGTAIALAWMPRGRWHALKRVILLVVVIAVRLFRELTSERRSIHLAADRPGELPHDTEVVVRAAIA